MHVIEVNQTFWFCQFNLRRHIWTFQTFQSTKVCQLNSSVAPPTFNLNRYLCKINFLRPTKLLNFISFFSLSILPSSSFHFLLFYTIFNSFFEMANRFLLQHFLTLHGSRLRLQNELFAILSLFFKQRFVITYFRFMLLNIKLIHQPSFRSTTWPFLAFPFPFKLFTIFAKLKKSYLKFDFKLNFFFLFICFFLFEH